MSENKEMSIKNVYKQLIEAWNKQDAEGMSNLFTVDGESIGFDGSMSKGRKEIFSHISPIFNDHQTASFVYKVKEVKFIDNSVAILRAIAGMVPPGESDIKSEVNTHHTLVLLSERDIWKIELFQNTPAQFHGRPELVNEMTNELRELL